LGVHTDRLRDDTNRQEIYYYLSDGEQNLPYRRQTLPYDYFSEDILRLPCFMNYKLNNLALHDDGIA
jgi:hypothetical protein